MTSFFPAAYAFSIFQFMAGLYLVQALASFTPTFIFLKSLMKDHLPLPFSVDLAFASAFLARAAKPLSASFFALTPRLMTGAPRASAAAFAFAFALPFAFAFAFPFAFPFALAA
eukprot:CAMPEP_0176278618 /NCGR_PEP_ID=MMETSP0121_2-20121125/48874_1 /TAXON_ID=160619 /ORGANISM="Kryptoperidinium foliaceum, Strain CCMP 1326" /LENGTH=113 /DNA_ID=CAMNT_0017618931 /DNA_START=327 /DNA_END=664 /DNA_ORIENTATION=-